MVRILFFAALGGAITLNILAALTDSSKFTVWGTTFLIATPLLLVLGVGQRYIRRTRTERSDIERATSEGRIRPARILHRRQTGMFVNEQPQVEFTLLVDAGNGPPFEATARKIISLLDVHETVPGNLVTVAHPDPKYQDIHIVDLPSPIPSRWFHDGATATITQLPKREATRAKSGFWSNGAVVLGAFLIGAIGGPFLATPDVPQYVQLILRGQPDEVRQLDHAVLFEPSELQTTLDAMTHFVGHDEVVSLLITDVVLNAEVPTTAGADTVDSIRLQDHEIIDHEPQMRPVADLAHDGFTVSDVDWAAVLAQVPHAQDMVADRGLPDANLDRIRVVRDDIDGLSRIDVVMYFADEYHDETVTFDAAGTIHPGEALATMTKEERASYLLDPEPLQQAMEEIVAIAETDQMTQITHHGDRLRVEAYRPAGTDPARTLSVWFDNGQVDDIDESSGSSIEPDKIFASTDIDWPVILDAIPKAQQAMEAAGTRTTHVTHIIVERHREHLSESYELVARVYLRDEFEDGGYVELTSDGSINRVVGP